MGSDDVGLKAYLEGSSSFLTRSLKAEASPISPAFCLPPVANCLQVLKVSGFRFWGSWVWG